MAATQAYDLFDQDENCVLEEGKVGELRAVSTESGAESHALHAGVNVVSRLGAEVEPEAWQSRFPGQEVNEILIDHPSISSMHAALYFEGSGALLCFVKDLGSTNKTRIRSNGSLLTLQRDDRYKIDPGDKVLFGAVEYEVEYAQNGCFQETDGSQDASPMEEDAQAQESDDAGSGRGVVEGGPDQDSPNATAPPTTSGHLPSILLERTQPLPESLAADQPASPIHVGGPQEDGNQAPPPQSLAFSDGDDVWVPPIGGAETQITRSPSPTRPQSPAPLASSPQLSGGGAQASPPASPVGDHPPAEPDPGVAPGSPDETEDGLEPDEGGEGEVQGRQQEAPGAQSKEDGEESAQADGGNEADPPAGGSTGGSPAEGDPLESQVPNSQEVELLMAGVPQFAGGSPLHQLAAGPARAALSPIEEGFQELSSPPHFNSPPKGEDPHGQPSRLLEGDDPYSLPHSPDQAVDPEADMGKDPPASPPEEEPREANGAAPSSPIPDEDAQRTAFAPPGEETQAAMSAMKGFQEALQDESRAVQGLARAGSDERGLRQLRKSATPQLPDAQPGAWKAASKKRGTGAAKGKPGAAPKPKSRGASPRPRGKSKPGKSHSRDTPEVSADPSDAQERRSTRTRRSSTLAKGAGEVSEGSPAPREPEEETATWGAKRARGHRVARSESAGPPALPGEAAGEDSGGRATRGSRQAPKPEALTRFGRSAKAASREKVTGGAQGVSTAEAEGSGGGGGLAAVDPQPAQEPDGGQDADPEKGEPRQAAAHGGPLEQAGGRAVGKGDAGGKRGGARGRGAAASTSRPVGKGGSKRAGKQAVVAEEKTATETDGGRPGTAGATKRSSGGMLSDGLAGGSSHRELQSSDEGEERPLKRARASTGKGKPGQSPSTKAAAKGAGGKGKRKRESTGVQEEADEEEPGEVGRVPSPDPAPQKSSKRRGRAGPKGTEVGAASETPAPKRGRGGKAGRQIVAGSPEPGDERGAGAQAGRAGASGKAPKSRLSRRTSEVANLSTPGSQTLTSGGRGDRRLSRKVEQRDVAVCFSKCVPQGSRKEMEKQLHSLGGRVVHDDSFTHFLTLPPQRGKDTGFSKSLNVLVALAAGRPIVTQSWLTASSKSGAFVPALDHLLVDRAAEKKFGFSLLTAYQAAQRRFLLTGTTVFLAPGLLRSEKDKGAGLSSLVEHAGGEVQTSMPSGAKGKKATGAWLLLATPADKKWAVANAPPGLQFHGRGLLTEHALLHQNLDRSQEILFST